MSIKDATKLINALLKEKGDDEDRKLALELIKDDNYQVKAPVRDKLVELIDANFEKKPSKEEFIEYFGNESAMYDLVSVLPKEQIQKYYVNE